MFGKKSPGSWKQRIQLNSPVTLCFLAVCLLTQLLNLLTGGWANRTLFSVYRSPLSDPLAYFRCILHVFGHADWEHLAGNMLYLLILCPMMEEKYGWKSIVLMMLTTAVVTGIINVIFFPNVMLLGASGIVFALILLAPFTNTNGKGIPLTFILVAVLYLGQQIYQGLFQADQISQLSHIIGGFVGAGAGFLLNRCKPVAA